MSTIKTYAVKGMHCASCASIIEKTFKKVDGVHSAQVNYGTEKVKVVFDDAKTNQISLSKTIEPLGYSLVSEEDHSQHGGVGQAKDNKLKELSEIKEKVISIMPLAVFSIFVMSSDILAQFNLIPEIPFVWKDFFHHLLPVFATYAMFVVGKPYLQGFYRFLRYGKANMDSLIGIGTSVAFIYSLAISSFEDVLRPFINVDNTYYDVTIVVIAFITLGKYLEMRSKIKTGDAIEKLLNLQAKTAIVIRNGAEVEIPVEKVIHEEIIVIKPAGKIPVDGILISGSSFIDESMITGEPMPVSKYSGDTIVAGTINTTGSFTFKATKVGSETVLAHIIKMVEEAQGSKAPIQALADKISSVFVPIVVVISFITLALWLLVGTPYLGFSQSLSFALVSFVGVLVIACPCALGLATPTAIIVGVGKGAGEGILIKDAATLEELHKVDVIVVDKTGTITKGKPDLISIQNLSGKNEVELISVLASLENKSEHPIAHAIVGYAKEKKIKISDVADFSVIKGRGLKGLIDGTEYFAGNINLIKELGIKLNTGTIEADTAKGKTPIILANKNSILGIILIADSVKPEAREAVSRLHKLGIKVVMLTGDNKNTAKYIADQVGIDEVVSEVMPEDKLNKIKQLQSEGKIVAMAGDGINDAPALAQANVGIAMATGTDVAIESAGITLLHGDISKLVKAISLSKITMRGIKQNLFWAFIYNIVGIPIAAGLFYPISGWLISPVFAGLAMGLSSVSVVSNSLRLKNKSL